MYTRMRRFEWSEAKNESNQKKHGIDFETAQLAFDDPFSLSFIDRVDDSEERWHAIGMIENIILIVVVHTYRVEGPDEVIRIISSRRATSHERKLYDKANC
jgi:uncharacterized DUF497 family protein